MSSSSASEQHRARQQGRCATERRGAGVAAEVVELVPGALYRLGGRVARDGRLSWAGADGMYEPVSCYLMLEGRHGLLVDTGVAAHESLIVAQLDALLPSDAELSIFLTRAELDCMGNLASIARKFAVSGVLTGGVINPFDAFDHVTSLVPEAVVFERGADMGTVRVAAGRELLVLRPTLRQLATFWGYDRKTKTMFTSDAFGHVAAADRHSPAVATAGSCLRSKVEAGIRSKFAWIADCAAGDLVADTVAELFERYETDVIAPTHGCVLGGPELVAEHTAAVVDELRRHGRGGRRLVDAP